MSAVSDVADPLAEDGARAEFRARVREVIQSVSPPTRVQHLDHDAQADSALLSALADMGVFRAGAPLEVGGTADVRDQLVVIEELGAGPSSSALLATVQFMAIQLLSDAMKAGSHRDLRDGIIAGEARVAFCLTEPAAGTDIARSMKVTAHGEGASGWLIAGEKSWVSGAESADELLVVARSGPPSPSSIDGISIFRVPVSADGVEIAPMEVDASRSARPCTVSLNVRLSNDALVGEAGRGFRLLLRTLNRERMNATAGSLGLGRSALAAAVEWAKSRPVSGSTVGSMQAIQHRLADVATQLEAARALLLRAAAIEQGGGDSSQFASMAKLLGSEGAQRATQEGLQVMGASGFLADNPIGRWSRDARVWSIAPLNNDVVRSSIAEQTLKLPRAR